MTGMARKEKRMRSGHGREVIPIQRLDFTGEGVGSA